MTLTNIILSALYAAIAYWAGLPVEWCVLMFALAFRLETWFDGFALMVRAQSTIAATAVISQEQANEINDLQRRVYEAQVEQVAKNN